MESHICGYTLTYACYYSEPYIFSLFQIGHKSKFAPVEKFCCEKVSQIGFSIVYIYGRKNFLVFCVNFWGSEHIIE